MQKGHMMRSIRWIYAQSAFKRLALLASMIVILSACQTEASSQALLAVAEMPLVTLPSATPVSSTTTAIQASPTLRPTIVYAPTVTVRPMPDLAGRILFTRKLQDLPNSEADLFEWHQGQIKQLPLRGLIVSFSPNGRFFVTHQQSKQNGIATHLYSIYDREKDFRDPFNLNVENGYGGKLFINDDGKTIAFGYICELTTGPKLIVGDLSELADQLDQLGKTACANKEIPFVWGFTWIAGTNKLIVSSYIRQADPRAAELGIDPADLPTWADFTRSTTGELALIRTGSWDVFAAYSTPGRPVTVHLAGQNNLAPRSLWFYDHEKQTLESIGMAARGFILSPDQRYTIYPLPRLPWSSSEPCIQLNDRL